MDPGRYAPDTGLVPPPPRRRATALHDPSGRFRARARDALRRSVSAWAPTL